MQDQLRAIIADKEEENAELRVQLSSLKHQYQSGVLADSINSKINHRFEVLKAQNIALMQSLQQVYRQNQALKKGQAEIAYLKKRISVLESINVKGQRPFGLERSKQLLYQIKNGRRDRLSP